MKLYANTTPARLREIAANCEDVSFIASEDNANQLRALAGEIEEFQKTKGRVMTKLVSAKHHPVANFQVGDRVRHAIEPDKYGVGTVSGFKHKGHVSVKWDQRPMGYSPYGRNSFHYLPGNLVKSEELK